MISIDNEPINHQANDHDFNVEAYRQLIRLALTNYQAADYRSIPWGQRFVLWRHDCDFSLNRSLALAEIETAMDLRSTFFVNPHCEFYNLLEISQVGIVKQLVRLGHDIGLHFDAAFYATSSEEQLNEQVSHEADLLEHFVGVRPAAFSFHNPLTFHLTCEAETYGGLINCYSKRFKADVPYCSDSNGYWRFRRLFDVLNEAKDPCLQVLTHPGWWQNKSIPPRQRVFDSVYGRANATMRIYDQGLTNVGRLNLAGKSQAILFLKVINLKLFELCDYLWNTEQFMSLFVELWLLHELQINKLCKAVLRKEWKVTASEVNAFFENSDLAIDGWRLFVGVFEISWQEATGIDEETHRDWICMCNQLVHGRSTVRRDLMETGCLHLCKAIESLAAWGRLQPIGYDGLTHLGVIGIPTYKTADGKLTDLLEEVAGDISGFPTKRWKRFKSTLVKVGTGETGLDRAFKQSVSLKTDSDQ
jgi:hypothetical protein